MQGHARAAPANVLVASDGAGRPARALGGSPGAHITACWEPLQHFAKPVGSLQQSQKCWMKHPISSNHLHLCWEHNWAPCLSPVGSVKSTRIKQELTGK